MSDCRLCTPETEIVLWYDERCRVVDANSTDYPGYCRIIWNAHVREMSDLAVDDRHRLYRVLDTVEEAVRLAVHPDKINLASLGNQVPHLHWHVIPRFADDPHFPDAIWAPRRRDSVTRAFDRSAFQRELMLRLAQL